MICCTWTRFQAGRRGADASCASSPTSTREPFARLLEHFGAAAGLPSSSGSGWLMNLGRGLVHLFHPKHAGRSSYDAFMLRFHDYLKANEEFQERGPKRLWTFPPGSVWLAMTDTCSHAVLRGRYALEHSYFISPEVQALPAESPPELLAAACRAQRPSQAA
jgi:3-deoxy-D-manno-oct-2-ulosonic acid (Kdo) hydroxylase